MISKKLLRLCWNWNCQCCQHCMSFVDVWYLLDNPVACITSLFRSKNEWVSFSWGFLRPNNWGESPNTYIMLSCWLECGYLWKSTLQSDTKSDFVVISIIKNHVYEQFQFQCHCDSHLCNSGVQTFSFKVPSYSWPFQVYQGLLCPLF